MDDLISRQAAIDALNEQIKYCDKAIGSFDISMEDEYAVKVERASLMAYAEKLEELPSVQPEPQWIPCSERMPDNDESVLISNSHGVTKAWWNGRFWTSIAVKKYKTVAAWMPLPEPYRGE